MTVLSVVSSNASDDKSLVDKIIVIGAFVCAAVGLLLCWQEVLIFEDYLKQSITYLKAPVLLPAFFVFICVCFMPVAVLILGSKEKTWQLSLVAASEAVVIGLTLWFYIMSILSL